MHFMEKTQESFFVDLLILYKKVFLCFFRKVEPFFVKIIISLFYLIQLHFSALFYQTFKFINKIMKKGSLFIVLLCNRL